jgi:hypothetical protein
MQRAHPRVGLEYSPVNALLEQLFDNAGILVPFPADRGALPCRQIAVMLKEGAHVAPVRLHEVEDVAGNAL